MATILLNKSYPTYSYEKISQLLIQREVGEGKKKIDIALKKFVGKVYNEVGLVECAVIGFSHFALGELKSLCVLKE